LSGAAKRILLNYDWPGNIRELENTIHRALLSAPGDTLQPDDFKLSGLRPQSVSLIPTLECALHALYEKAPPKLFDLLEETIIRTAFEFCGQNQVQTSQFLDISRNILRHRMTLYDMLPERQTGRRRSSGASAKVEKEAHGVPGSGLP
jgi:sigma-54-specific transcriptional regulator